jgi:hypothetical protein
VGDLDHNGMVGLKDILLLGISDNICASCSDINCDSVIDEKDAEGLRMLILQGK